MPILIKKYENCTKYCECMFGNMRGFLKGFNVVCIEYSRTIWMSEAYFSQHLLVTEALIMNGNGPKMLFLSKDEEFQQGSKRGS